MKPKVMQSGFALATGLMFLLVLTLIAIVAMQGTKLELAMATAVTRQEQAFEMTELTRVVSRQSQAVSLIKGNRIYIGKQPNIPVFAAILCPGTAGGGGGQIGEKPTQSPGFVFGFNCNGPECMAQRVQKLDQVTDLWNISYPNCDTSTSPALLNGSGGLIKLSVDNSPGRDLQPGQDEVPTLVTAFGRGSTADGGDASTVAFFNVRTIR